MPGSQWVAYVGPFRFPWGQPGSRRVYGIAKALAAAGRRVVVCSGEDGPREAEVLERDGRGCLCHVGTGELHRRDASPIGKAFRILITQGTWAVRWLDAQKTRPTHVIAYGALAPFMARLLPWCRRNGVPIVADVVEWYQGSHQPGGTLGPFNASTKLALRYYYPRCDGVIAISSFLERHFLNRGVKVIRVPPTLDVAAAPARGQVESPSMPLRLVYAGTPGKKDLLGVIVRAVGSLDRGANLLRLEVFGVTRKEAEGLHGAAPLPSCVDVLGIVPQASIMQIYQRSDFSLLLREPLRYAQAGFPTKIVESLAAGVPVICNVTSDLGECIRDGVSGLHAANATAPALVAALKRALALSGSQRSEMGAAARRAAEQHFDYRCHAAALSAFLDEVAH